MITNVIAALVLCVPTQSHADLRERALRLLRDALASEQRWGKVHAAEALLASGERDESARAFGRELASSGGEPQYRIGIWRVLAQAAPDDREREKWIRRIADAFLDTAGPDRLHASETLGKLGYRARGTEIAAFEAAARGVASPLAANALWVLTSSGVGDAEARLVDLLASTDPGTRATAVYAVRYLATLSPASFKKLAAAARAEPADNIVRASLVSAAFVHAPPDQQAAFKRTLVALARRGDADMKSEACAALGSAGDGGDLAFLTARLDDPSVDVRVAAASAVLRITKR